MSKRKGRKPARSSEIKSVLRAPPEGENELEAASGDSTDPDSDTLPLEVLGEAVDADAGAEPEDSPAPSEPAPPVEPAPAPRARRLRAVRADDPEAVSAESAAESVPSEPEQHAAAPSDENSDSDAEVDRASDDRGGDGDPFVPFPIQAEGDDTEAFLRGLIEALLFTAQKPLDLKDLARSAGVDKPRAKELVEQLMTTYDGRGLCIEQVAGGFVMRSSSRYAPYIQKILALRPVRLSRAQLETLAIIAYRQPVTKPEVDDIRGVDSGQVIKGLLERALLKMLGKKDEPGRPTLYGTTNDFLELLNLQSLKDLPTLREYTELSEESQRKFEEQTGETAPSAALSFERPLTTPEEGNGSDEQAVLHAADESASESALEAGDGGAPPQTTEADDEANGSAEGNGSTDTLEETDVDEAVTASRKANDDEVASESEESDEATSDSDEDDDDSDDDDDDSDDDDDDDDDSDDDDE